MRLMEGEGAPGMGRARVGCDGELDLTAAHRSPPPCIVVYVTPLGSHW